MKGFQNLLLFAVDDPAQFAEHLLHLQLVNLPIAILENIFLINLKKIWIESKLNKNLILRHLVIKLERPMQLLRHWNDFHRQ